VKDILFDSPPLSATATSFTIPNGVLQLGGSYAFDVILDDQVTSGSVENRSETFSSPFAATPEPATLLLLGLGFGSLGTAIRGGRHRP